MKSLLYITLAGFLFAGCANVGYSSLAFAQKSKEDILKSITKNKTTKKEINNIYGNPDHINYIGNNEEQWTYVTIRAEYIPIFNFGAKNSLVRQLVILFKNNVVEDYTYNVTNEKYEDALSAGNKGSDK